MDTPRHELADAIREQGFNPSVTETSVAWLQDRSKTNYGFQWTHLNYGYSPQSGDTLETLEDEAFVRAVEAMHEAREAGWSSEAVMAGLAIVSSGIDADKETKG